MENLLGMKGIKVIDLSRVIAGPWCGALLGDLGAEVIKVEGVASGDESRSWPPHKDGEAAAYLHFNRNKRSVCLDLKKQEGIEVLKTLIREADVLIENFRTGTMESFGLGYETLSEINPRLVYASVSAFGRSGPLKDRAGYEALMQAYTGIMSITGEPDGQPVRSGVSLLDLSTGILCALGISTALLNRARTGRGQRVEASLFETAVSMLAFHAAGYLMSGAVPKALGSSHPSLCPYRTFECDGGEYIFIAAGNDRFWAKLAKALGLDDLATDPKYEKNKDRVSNRVELERILAEKIITFKRDTLLAMLEDADVPATPVNSVPQALNTPQAQECGIIQHVDHKKLGEIPYIGTPLKFSGQVPRIRQAAPLYGEHTYEVLAEHGYTKTEIDQLVEKQIAG